MEKNALIQETLKYLETDGNGKPKYKFEIYKSGISKYYRDNVSRLSAGLINLKAEEDDKIPVSVYTIGDIFDTVSETKDYVLDNISALPDTLNNIKASLNELGYSALDTAINTIKAAVIPIEVIQTVDNVYRVARPLVEKVVDIASIMFYYSAAAKVTQDILQYLTRLAVSTAKNYLDKLWGIFLDTPVFAVYEDDSTANLANAYSAFADAANAAIDDLARDADAFSEIMAAANSAAVMTYEPKYSDLGISISEDIVDVASDINTRRVYIASEHKIYSVDARDYSTSEVFATTKTIKKIFCYNSELYFLTSDGVYKAETGAQAIMSGNFTVIYSNPVLLYDDSTGNFFKIDEAEAAATVNNVEYHTYDNENNTLYLIIKNSKYELVSISKDDDNEYYVQALGELSGRPYGMSYFNNVLYIVMQNSSGKFYMSKINAGLSFDRTKYSYNEGEEPRGQLIWIDDDYATDGENIYSHIGGDFDFVTDALNSINCVTKKKRDGENYFVCSGGFHLYVSSIGNPGYKWNTKVLINKEEDSKDVPDNIAGLTWYTDDASGDFLIVYSQEHIYLLGPDVLDKLFTIDKPEKPEPLLFKEFRTFNEWFSEDEPQNIVSIPYSSKFDMPEGCIITDIRIINKQIYVGLYNTTYVAGNDSLKCGIYKADVSASNGSYNIAVGTIPVCYSKQKRKIYSFIYKNNCWYYTDGKSVYNFTYNTETDLKIEKETSKEEEEKGAEHFDADRALYLTEETDDILIYTAQSIMKSSTNRIYGEVSSLINYKTANVPEIASTRNILMFSDGKYVYSIVDNDEDDINYDMFQICYKKSAFDYRLIQSNDAVFIVSKNTVKKVPLYSSIVSSLYGCGYDTDTTPNKWHGAAPYYFTSNVLKERKNSGQRDIFIASFINNFKVELTKLLKNIPDAFVAYTKDRLADKLKELGVEIEGDDGQIANLIIESISSTTANSMGMYIQQKFFEKIGDDETYETFALQVYNACIEDSSNNMTDDFYKIFEQLYYSTIAEAITEKNLGKGGMSNALLRYYQNHKGEWATSMTDLIDIDIVDPEIYERPLNNGEDVKRTTYRFSYPDNEYKYEYISNPSSRFLNENIINGYFYSGKFYADASHTVEIDKRIKSGNDYYDASGNIICYGDGTGNFYKYKLQNYTLSEDTAVVLSKDYYEKTGDNQYIYELTSDTEEQPNKPYFEIDYTDTDDTSVISGKSYYTITGGGYDYILQTDPILENDSYFIKQEYTLTDDEEVDYHKSYYTEEYVTPGTYPAGVQRYTLGYIPTTDTEIDWGKNYYELTDLSMFVGKDYYEYNPTESGIKYSIKYVQAGSIVLEPDTTYYIKNDNGTYSEISLNEDGSNFDHDRTYYTKSTVETYPTAVGEADSITLESGVTYYKKNGSSYSSTTITKENFDPDVTYYKKTTFTVPDGESTETKNIYTPVYIPAVVVTDIYTPTYIRVINPTLDYTETYYTRSGEPGNYVYTVAENIDEQYGPYFKVNGFKEDQNGTYIKKTISTGTVAYTLVTNPQLNNLSSYYELAYIPDDDGLLIINYIHVEYPSMYDLGKYYEKSAVTYVPAEGLTYVYNADGTIAGIENNRNLYKIEYRAEVITPVLEPSGNPKNQGWYETVYIQAVPGSFNNPSEEGLYERGVNEIAFTKVENPTGNPKTEGWFEYSFEYSTPYDDGKVYIDLAAIPFESNFDIEDAAWHNIFYNEISYAKDHLPETEDVDELKAAALEALNGINYRPYPSDIWQMLITKAVTEYYIPQQGTQFRQIVLDSNMYPIQWNELPDNIDRTAFDYALTALLYAIKQKLITNITILVDGGKVKCYSCVDASTVIKKMVDKNGNIWNNLLGFVKTRVNKAASVDEVKKAFNIVKTYEPSRSMLEIILNQQSRLYSKYIDQLIEVQIINDNETEVM